MPVADNQALINGRTYALVSDSQLPSGRRAWTRKKRPSQSSDPGVQQTASWRLNGPHGLSREDPAGGALAVDYTENADTLYESLLIPGPKRNPIDLLTITSAARYVELLNTFAVTVPFTAAASNAAIGTAAWANPANALVDDTTYAAALGSAVDSQYLQLTAGAATRVPSGKTVTGFSTRVRRYANQVRGDVSFVAATQTSASTTAAGEITLVKPVGVTTDDVMIAVMMSNANMEGTAPSGWVPVYLSGNFTTVSRFNIWLKVAGGSEPADYEFFNPNASFVAGGISAYRNCDATTPLDVAAAAAAITTGTVVNQQSIDTTTDGAMLIAVFAAQDSGAWTTSSGMTERIDQSAVVVASIALDDEQRQTAGSTGNRTATHTGSSKIGGVVFALRAALTPETVTDNEVRLVVGNAVVGDDRAKAGDWPSVATEVTYGAASDSQGVVLTSTNVNAAGLGIALSATVDGEARVEFAEGTVYYEDREIVPIYEARVGAFPVGAAPVGGGTYTSSLQPVTLIDEDRGALFFDGGAFSVQVEPTGMTAVAYEQFDAGIRGDVMWRNKSYLGLGGSQPMQRRTVVTPTSTTYEDVEISSDPLYAAAEVVGPDRFWYVNPEDPAESVLQYSLDALETVSNPFQVGDPGIPATGLGTYGRSAVVGSEVGAFGFTELGISVRVLESLRGQRSPFNGQWITTLWGWTYITSSIGLKATIPGQVENPAGPGADRRYEGPNGRVTAIWAYKDALFCAVLTVDGDTYLYRGEFDDGRYGGSTASTGRPAWFPFAFLEATSTSVIFSTGLRTNPTLLVGEDLDASYFTLSEADRDIADPLYRFFTGTARWFGTTMMRAPNMHKNLRYFTTYAEDADADNSYQIAVSVDEGAYQDVGSPLIATGHRFLRPTSGTGEDKTPLDTVSGHFFKPRVTGTLANDVSPAFLRGTLDMCYDERPDTIIEHVFVFELGATLNTPAGDQEDFAALSNLYAAHGQGAASPFAFELPGQTETVYGLVSSFGPVIDMKGDGVMRAELTICEWVTGATDDDDD